MNITKEIISDLFPLYAANVCSPDSRKLVEDYLRAHPREADELRRIGSLDLPARSPAPKAPAEMASLNRARQLVRQRSWLMAFAIFFTLAPFWVLHSGGRTYWLFLESPKSALVYGVIGVVSWIGYGVMRARSNSLAK